MARQDDVKRGKGYALDYAFMTLSAYAAVQVQEGVLTTAKINIRLVDVRKTIRFALAQAHACAKSHKIDKYRHE